MVTNLFFIKIKGIFRHLLELGAFRLFLVVIFSLCILLGVRKANSSINLWVGYVMTLLILFTTHFNRADISFLKITIPNFRFFIYFEYLLLAIFLGIWWFSKWYMWLCILPSIFIILLLSKPNYSSKNLKIPLSPEIFEWISGIRATFHISIIAILLLGLGVLFRQYILMIASIVIIFLQTGTFYKIPEDLKMILCYPLNPVQFILKKIFFALKYLFCYAFVFVSITLISYPEHYIISFVILGIATFLIVGFIFAKYAFYPNSLGIQISQSLLTAFFVGAFLSPILLLVGLIGIGWFAKKSFRNLEQYLYD